MTNKELKRVDMLVGFINYICEVVCDPDCYLDPNTKDSSVLSIGYYENNNKETIISSIDSDSLNDLKLTLKGLENQIKACSKTNFSKKWEELRSK